jgi:tetratricopeptide (TPR) repeat protein
MADAAASAPAGGSFEPPEGTHKMSLSHEQRLAEAARLREKGNAQFRAGNLEGAEATYEQGASLFTYMNAESPLDPSYAAQNLESCEAAVPLYNNLALCLQRRRAWKACAEACTEALDLLPDDRKATLRRGVVRVELDLWDEAESDLKRALALDPRGARRATPSRARAPRSPPRGVRRTPRIRGFSRGVSTDSAGPSPARRLTRTWTASTAASARARAPVCTTPRTSLVRTRRSRTPVAGNVDPPW